MDNASPMLRVDHCVTFFEFHALASLDLTPKGYGLWRQYPLIETKQLFTRISTHRGCTRDDGDVSTFLGRAEFRICVRREGSPGRLDGPCYLPRSQSRRSRARQGIR